jgi:hypothetical protein
MGHTQTYRHRPVTQVDTPAFSHGAGAPGITVESGIFKPCPGCGNSTNVRLYGKPGHYGCLTRQNADTEPGPEEINAFRMLEESIRASVKHPVLRVPLEQRDLAPWNLMTEPMRGEHRWRRPVDPGATVVVLDRRGSYPSAMGNVPVAVNRLHHTGPLDAYDPKTAGIFLVGRVGDAADGTPHPFGEIAFQPGKAWWITTPHLRLGLRLAREGRLPAIRILDSWTGVAGSTLFRQFADDTARARARATGDAYVEVKRKTSIAIRSLWPKGARSPFWRPDWSLSVRAEAAVRHWVRADQARRTGANLVRLGNVDEVAFALEPGETEIPPPYEVGPKFGQVAVKRKVPGEVWNAETR